MADRYLRIGHFICFLFLVSGAFKRRYFAN
jgi:hypothetical protein